MKTPISIKLSTVHAIYLSFILLLLGILPVLIKKVTNTSYLTGILFFTFIIFPFIYKYANSLKNIPTKIVLFITIFIIYMLIQNIIFGSLWSQKAYLSIFIILYMISISFLSMIWFKNSNLTVLVKVFKMLVYILYLILFFNIFMNYPYASFYNHPKSIVPFAEPSHYALFSGMFFIIYFVITDKWIDRVLIIVCTTLFAILIPNTTMLIFALLMISLLIRLNIKYIFITIIMIPITFYLLMHTSHFLNRVNISDEGKDNLSKLVYLQGIDYAKSSLINTNGLGLGFQMMGTQEASKVTKKILILLNTKRGRGLNREDGGFLAAKIITEFGIFGIILLCGYLYLFVKSFLYLRKNIVKKLYQDEDYYKSIITYAIIFSFFIELFVRGIGYFTPTTFIFLIALLYYFKYTTSKRT